MIPYTTFPFHSHYRTSVKLEPIILIRCNETNTYLALAINEKLLNIDL